MSARLEDGVAEVSVADTGIGIALADQEAVFEEFRQVGTADKSDLPLQALDEIEPSIEVDRIDSAIFPSQGPPRRLCLFDTFIYRRASRVFVNALEGCPQSSGRSTKELGSVFQRARFAEQRRRYTVANTRGMKRPSFCWECQW